ncbi:pyridoxal-phosphate dependent enzyme [Corynebacterium auriscanis]|uniref:pyridoxal-phosphate dependent enzyme n=1 Tax=Corynebacterium auriscanis TaxID=99807 RepID=UPI0024AD8C54|nr:pyridoxal-phosphate dependent enzyme [Corynebacterium auriscanis]
MKSESTANTTHSGTVHLNSVTNAKIPQGLDDLIGHTPLVELSHLAQAFNRTDVHIYAKLEQFNPGGSAKDRTARALVQAAVEAGMPENPTLVESSSGNLGMALARQAQMRGWNFYCVVDPRVNDSTVATMHALGAHVELIEEPDPETGDWLTARRARVAELMRTVDGAVNLDQYSNQAAFSAHDEGTMAEIIGQLGYAPDWLFVAMSTTGTIGGCIQRLQRIGAATCTVGVDAHGSVLYQGKRGERMLPGFGAGVVPHLATINEPSRVQRVHDIDSVIGARALARTEGLIPGASGGAVISALHACVPHIPEGASVVIVLHDGGTNYLNTIYDDGWVQENLQVSAEDLESRINAIIGEGSAR